jgi:prevent-host-death family protein
MSGGMMEVGIRELKNGLSRYLGEVKRGEEITVTNRGKVVARLVSAQPRAIERLVAEGLVELAPRRRKYSRRVPTVKLSGRGPSLAEYIVEQRG